jgi:hypothetical protein
MVKRIRRPAGAFPTLPAGMDKILKEHFDSHRKEGTTPGELEGRFEGRLFTDMEKLRDWRNNFRGLRFTDEQAGITLMGALDDLFVTPEGLYAPLDFKTRGYPLKQNTHEYYQHQMDIYSFLLEKNSLPPAGFAILLFYHPKQVTSTCRVEFHAEPVKIKTSSRQGEKIFYKALECLQGEEPGKGSECAWCSWER